MGIRIDFSILVAVTSVVIAVQKNRASYSEEFAGSVAPTALGVCLPFAVCSWVSCCSGLRSDICQLQLARVDRRIIS